MRSRGVLDRPVKPGDDSFVVAGVLPNPSFFLRAERRSNPVFLRGSGFLPWSAFLADDRVEAPRAGTGCRKIKACEAEQGWGRAAVEKRVPYRRSRFEHMPDEICECHLACQYERRNPRKQSNHQKAAHNQFKRAGRAYE